MSLGEKIQQLRKAGGLSQEQLADLLNVSRQAISKWETDQSTPELDKILALSKLFAITTDELLGNELPLANTSTPPPLREAATANIKSRRFTLGWVTLILGLFLLVLDFAALLFIQASERAGGSWFTNAMMYASQPPMPFIFAISVLIVISGIGLMLSSKK